MDNAYLFLTSLGFGFLSLLTPCVFPLIPITVSYFSKRAESDGHKPFVEGFLFSIGIIITFTIIGVLTSILFGASAISKFATSPVVNIIIGCLFVFFALNLFGLYEINVPSSILTNLTKASESKKGYAGIYLMSFTFTLTTFTCTMPFLGTVLVSASRGMWITPVIGMFGYSIAFALPFFFLAVFPSFLLKLPRSGGWMLSVKVGMGFLELAAALKFFSNADLVLGTNFIDRSRFLLYWSAIFFTFGFYLIGIFRFSHEPEPREGKNPLRIILAIFVFAFALNLSFATSGKKLGELESYLPPEISGQSSSHVDKDELFWLDDLDKGLLQSRMTGKKVFIDFTGFNCTNCRWMESNIFVLPEIKSLLNNYILVRLYTDGDGEVYDKNLKYEEDTFGTIALPLYAILDSDGKVLSKFEGMTRDQEEFKKIFR